MQYSGDNRGRGRGRARGSFQQYPTRSNVVLPPPRDMMAGLGAIIGALDRDTLSFVKGTDRGAPASPPAKAANSGEVTFDDARPLGSYNWTDEPGKILVPGGARIWKDPSIPFTAQKDSELNPAGTNHVDQNSHKFPAYPLLPLFAAVDAGGVPFDWPSADVITDRNGLRKLIRWATDAAKLDDFRIDAERLGFRTVLLGRWEAQNVREANQFGFGFGFEQATTREAPGCEDATGYHRIITYDFAGLQMVVRYEVDAAFPSSTKPSRKGDSSSVDALATLLSGASLGASKSPPPTARLTVVRAGAPVPQSAVLELTTRSTRNAPGFDWAEALPQLLLSRTPTHVLGVHERGAFAELRTNKVGSPALRAAEADAQAGLQKLRAVLEAVQDLLLEDADGKKVSLVCKNGKLRVYERTGKGLLPEETMARFET